MIDKEQLQALSKNKKEPTWVCPNCGSPNIEEQHWVTVNTRKLTTPIDSEYWCPDCEQHTKKLTQKN